MSSPTPYLDYLQAQPRYSDSPKWFPGMGTKPKTPRDTSLDHLLWKSRAR